MVVTRKLAAVHTPGPAWPMGSAVPGLITSTRQREARGTAFALLPGCGSASGRTAWIVCGFVGSSVRPVGVLWRRLQRLATSLASSPTTTAPRTPGFTVSRACRPFPPVRRRGGCHRLRADGRGRGRDITGEKVKPYAAGRRPPPVSRQRRRPRSPPSGEPVRAGSQDPALPPHRTACRWPGVRPHATDRQGSGAVLSDWEPVTDV